MKAEFTEFTNTTNWVKGLVYTKDKTYTFEAKLFDEGSDYGIKNGRVSKLMIWDEEVRRAKQNIFDACIMNYDRGWDIRVKKENKEIYNTVMTLLENSPKRFDTSELTPEEYANPKNHNLSLETWDEIFNFQAKKEGGNYTLLKEWLKKNCEVPKLKS